MGSCYFSKEVAEAYFVGSNWNSYFFLRFKVQKVCKYLPYKAEWLVAQLNYFDNNQLQFKIQLESNNNSNTALEIVRNIKNTEPAK